MDLLENACNALLYGNNIERKQADEYLKAFRQSKVPYNLCSHILQQSENMNAKYEALATIRIALLREWTFLDIQWTESFRTHLFEYTINQIDNLPSYIVNQLVLVIALMLKRGWKDHETATGQMIMSQLDALLIQSNSKHQHVGLAVACAIVSEFNITLNSGSNLGVPWDYHVECHISFERILLPELLKRAIGMIEKCIIQDKKSPTLSNSLQLLESILCWEYVDNTDASSLLLRVISRTSDDSDTSAEGSVFVEPGPSLKGMIVNSSLVEIVSNCYQQISHTPNSAASKFCRSCIVQLMSVRGKIFSSLEEQNQYMKKLWKSLAIALQTIVVNVLPKKGQQNNSNTIVEYSDLVMGVSRMYNRLLATYSFRDFITLVLNDTEMLKIVVACLNMIANITLNLLPLALLNPGDVETWQNETLDSSLAFWVRLSALFDSLSLRDLSSIPKEMMKEFQNDCNDIFKAFVQHQLSAACTIAINNTENLEAHEQFKESLHDMDRLLDIGHIGRINSLNSIGLINNLIEQRNNKLMSIANNQVNISNVEIIAIHEELYWLFHILGEVLTDSSNGEIPLIPRNCLQVSFEFSQQQQNSGLPDPIGHSADIILAHCELESQILQNKSHSILLSPLVVESSMWFLTRWCASYLMPQAALYDLLNPSLWNTIGAGADYAKLLLSKIVEKLVINLVHWNDERILGDNARIRKYLHGLSSYQTLLQAYVNDDHRIKKLNSIPLQKLVRSFCQTAIPNSFDGMTNDERQQSENEFFVILKSLEQRIHTVIGTANFEKIVHTHECKREVQFILDIMIGIGTSNGSDCFQLAFKFLLQYLPHCCQLIQYFSQEDSTIVSCVLNLFACLASGEIEYISIEMYQSFMMQCHNVIDVFVVHNTKRLQEFRNLGQKLQSLNMNELNADRDAIMARIESESEDQYIDVTTILNLLQQLADKINPLNGTSDFAIEVVLYGINKILPSLNENVMLFPDICKAYFQLIEEITRNHGEHFIKLQSNTLTAIIESLMYALNHHLEEVAYMGIKTLAEITSFQYHADMSGKNNGPWAPVMCDLVAALLEHIFIHQIRFRLVDAISDALLPALQWVIKATETPKCRLLFLKKIPEKHMGVFYQINHILNQVFIVSSQLEEQKNRSKFRKLMRKFIHQSQNFLYSK